ncbi:MurR/RpiR family transcriptional regulator [Alicyclobacillus dauci]|uniref:MurR/RpiR family transcriptional regulator n=1 Tax=Alicyclobacillus dauci TaxID=1475485 RepID=A0ABY6Z2Q5_9BACL|nr:MurR/RpiR family transcriptional regulator [Alicyclobacillus dauci]WAH37178.1 MurR/RpiR family transcriptional regulator [Alicyclobacillus dauci]
MLYMPGGGLVRLEESIPSLPESEARIAKYILDHPAEFVNMTVQDLAQSSSGSPAAVVRLWKSLGFDGYHDFKLRVASDLQSKSQTKYVELASGSSFGNILHSVEDSNIHSIQNTLRLLKESDVEKTVQALFQARTTVTMGVGASGVVADDIAQKLMRIGLPVNNARDFHEGAMLAAQLHEHDVFLAVSYSGTTSDVFEVAEIAKENQATVIALTRFGDTPLSRLADVCLYVSAVEPTVRVAATASRIAALVLIDTVFIYLANQDKDHVYNALEATRNVIAKHKID